MLLALLAAALLAEVHEPLHVGDVITVRGEGAFARVTNTTFWVDDEYASWERIDDDRAVMVVPAIDAGDHWLSFARAMNPDRKHAIGIVRLHIEPERERTLLRKRVNLPAAVGDDRIHIDASGTGTLELHRMESDFENAFIRSTLIQSDGPNAPPVTFGEVFVVDVSAAATLDVITVHLPESWLPALPPGYEPELYIYTEDHGANEEVIPGILRLRAEWNGAARELRVAFEEPFRVARGEPRTIYVGTRKIED